MQETKPPAAELRRGVVAVVTCGEEFLVIRRSRFVRAPRAYCFPGGGVEQGESETMALRREMREELSVKVEPVRRLWSSQTKSGVQLGWWRTRLPADYRLVANPDEVESFHWMTVDRLLDLPDLLSTNLGFIQAMQRGDFTI